MLLDIIHISTKCTSYYFITLFSGNHLGLYVKHSSRSITNERVECSKKSINQFYTSNDEFGLFAPLSGLIAYSLWEM